MQAPDSTRSCYKAHTLTHTPPQVSTKAALCIARMCFQDGQHSSSCILTVRVETFDNDVLLKRSVPSAVNKYNL